MVVLFPVMEILRTLRLLDLPRVVSCLCALKELVVPVMGLVAGRVTIAMLLLHYFGLGGGGQGRKSTPLPQEGDAYVAR